MDRIVTYGRYPSLGEVRAYYTRPDFLDYLLRTCAMRRVHLIIPTAKHWNPGEADRIIGSTCAELRDIVLARIAAAFPDAHDDERLPFYPSFHQGIERWMPRSLAGGPTGRDAVAEADLSTWREAFLDVRTLIATLREHDISCLCKFSGHRSLHVLVPYGLKHLRPFHFGESQAHTVHLLRMPYSLNEDTGLVSLPLTWEELPSFRPWHANLHLVTINDEWLCEPSPEERKRIHEYFTRVYREEAPVPRLPEPALDLPEMRARSRRLASLLPVEDGAPAAAWLKLREEAGVSADEACETLVSPDQDIRWLTAEAFLLHGNAISSSLVELLIRDEDPYVHATTMDVLTRFAGEASGYFVNLLQQEDLGQQSRSLYLLAVCERLREAVFAAILTASVRTAPLTLRLACVTGVVAGDWPLAWRFVAEGETEYGGTAVWRTGVEALTLLRALGEWSSDKQETLTRLVALGAGVVDLLLLAMATPHRHTRWEFLRAQSLLADTRALDVYVEALGSKYRDSVRWATRGLVALGAVAVPPLIEAAASDDARVRRYAVRCLGHLGDPRGRDAIRNALEDVDDTVCRQGAVALRRLVTDGDIPALRQVLRTRDWLTRREALATLLALGEAGCRAVTGLALQDHEPVAAGWLWRQGDPRGKAILLRAFAMEGETRRVVALELAHGPADPDVIDILVQYLPELQWDEQEQVANALGELRDPRGFDAVLALTKDRHFFARRIAVDALGRWGDPRAVDALMRRLDDENTKVRQHAGEALAAIGEPARAPLEAALQGTVSNAFQANAQTTLNTLEVIRQATEGEPIDMGLLARSWPSAIPRVAVILRERQAEDEYRRLAGHLKHERTGIRWFTRLLLLEIGEDARPILKAFIEETHSFKAKSEAESLLQELDRRQAEEENV